MKWHNSFEIGTKVRLIKKCKCCDTGIGCINEEWTIIDEDMMRKRTRKNTILAVVNNGWCELDKDKVELI